MVWCVNQVAFCPKKKRVFFSYDIFCFLRDINVHSRITFPSSKLKSGAFVAYQSTKYCWIIIKVQSHSSCYLLKKSFLEWNLFLVEYLKYIRNDSKYQIIVSNFRITYIFFLFDDISRNILSLSLLNMETGKHIYVITQKIDDILRRRNEKVCTTSRNLSLLAFAVKLPKM